MPSALILIGSPRDSLCKPLVENESGSSLSSHRAPSMVTVWHDSRAKIENSSPLGMSSSSAPSSGCALMVIPPAWCRRISRPTGASVRAAHVPRIWSGLPPSIPTTSTSVKPRVCRRSRDLARSLEESSERWVDLPSHSEGSIESRSPSTSETS